MTRKLAAIFAGAGVVLVAAFYFLLWAPSAKALTTANHRLDAARNDGVQVASERQRLLKARAGLPQMEDLAGQLAQAAPASANIPDLIDQINGVATQTGVTITREGWAQTTGSAPGAAPSVGSAPTAGGLSTLPLTLTVTGSQPALLAFVHDLSTMPRLVKVTTFTVSAPSGSASPAPSGPSTAAAGAPASSSTSISATVYVAPSKLPQAPGTH